MMIRVLKTNGKKFFMLQRFHINDEKGYWMTINFIPSILCIYLEVRYKR